MGELFHGSRMQLFVTVLQDFSRILETSNIAKKYFLFPNLILILFNWKKKQKEREDKQFNFNASTNNVRIPQPPSLFVTVLQDFSHILFLPRQFNNNPWTRGWIQMASNGIKAIGQTIREEKSDGRCISSLIRGGLN